MEKRTQRNEVLRHLKENGSITSWEAIKEYGATRLSAIIYDLRHYYDLNIRSERVQFTNRYGTKSTYVIYILEDKDTKLNDIG
jgi:hypothetical protein